MPEISNAFHTHSHFDLTAPFHSLDQQELPSESLLNLEKQSRKPPSHSRYLETHHQFEFRLKYSTRAVELCFAAKESRHDPCC